MVEQQYYAGVGRRKTSVARVRLVPGTGEIIVNGKPINDYFGSPNMATQVVEPFNVTNQLGRFNVDAKVLGGGRSGQADAIRMAIARALLAANDETRKPLRIAGFLTRDARVKERKKYGLKRARKAPQYTKR